MRFSRPDAWPDRGAGRPLSLAGTPPPKNELRARRSFDHPRNNGHRLAATAAATAPPPNLTATPLPPTLTVMPPPRPRLSPRPNPSPPPQGDRARPRHSASQADSTAQPTPTHKPKWRSSPAIHDNGIATAQSSPPKPMAAASPSSYAPGVNVLPHPPYPIEARNRGQTGTVVMNVQFDARGGVSAADVSQSSGVPILDSETRSFIRAHWHSPSYAGQTVRRPWYSIPARESASMDHRFVSTPRKPSPEFKPEAQANQHCPVCGAAQRPRKSARWCVAVRGACTGLFLTARSFKPCGRRYFPSFDCAEPLAEANFMCPIPTITHHSLKLARNGISRRTGGVPKCNLSTGTKDSPDLREEAEVHPYPCLHVRQLPGPGSSASARVWTVPSSCAARTASRILPTSFPGAQPHREQVAPGDQRRRIDLLGAHDFKLVLQELVVFQVAVQS